MSLDTTTIAALRAERQSVEIRARILEARLEALDLLIPREGDDGDDRPDEQPAATFTAADAVAHEAKRPVAKKRGTSKLRANLDADDIAEIRRAHASGEASYTALGAKFKVSRSTAENVVKRKGAYATA